MSKILTLILGVILLLCLAGGAFLYSAPEEFFLDNGLQFALDYGKEVVLAPFIVIILVIVIVFFIKRRNPSINQRKLLENERNRISSELKEAETQFLKHKIDRDVYDKVTMEKNAELIKVEAEIDSLKHSALGKEETKQMNSLSKDKQKVLSDLFEQKQRKLHEIKIAEVRYYKRKIDENAFKNLGSEINAELSSIDGQIKALQATNEIEKLTQQLKSAAAEVGKQKKVSDERNLETMEEDILSQVKE